MRANHGKNQAIFLGEKMRTRAAVALEAGKPLEVMDVELDGPRAGEVLVEIKATGLCHTDEFTRSGEDPEGIFPAILGHEGAGVVIEIGEGVTSLEVGDHVIPLYTPDAPQPDQDLINLVADAKRWSVELLNGKSCTIRQIEDRERLRSGSVSRILPLAWLAPDISTAILEGSQPQHLTAKKLRILPELPLEWQEQRKILGFPHQ